MILAWASPFKGYTCMCFNGIDICDVEVIILSILNQPALTQHYRWMSCVRWVYNIINYDVISHHYSYCFQIEFNMIASY